MADDRKIKWKRGVGWLLSVTNYIVELVPSKQTSKGGMHVEVMMLFKEVTNGGYQRLKFLTKDYSKTQKRMQY
ncbi:Rho guanine nucleotide exchange factor 8-like protein [Tanacetum coccineum]